MDGYVIIFAGLLLPTSSEYDLPGSVAPRVIKAVCSAKVAMHAVLVDENLTALGSCDFLFSR